MKITHKINHGWSPSRDIVVDDRYQAEIDGAVRRAQKAYREAQRHAARAERVAARRSEPQTSDLAAEARRLCGERLDELKRLQRQMEHAATRKGRVRIVNKGASL